MQPAETPLNFILTKRATDRPADFFILVLRERFKQASKALLVLINSAGGCDGSVSNSRLTVGGVENSKCPHTSLTKRPLRREGWSFEEEGGIIVCL